MTPSQNPDSTRLDPALANLAAGSRVGGGRFTLMRLLGHGGMGVVWLARDEHLHEEVALKFLPPDIRHDAVALDDLRRETSRSRKLTHPHIIRIHDLYKSDQEAFISMEFVEGSNLSELRLQQPDRVFTWNFLESIVRQLCEALDYAHGERVIHRDLKPANMMLDARGRLKLADFGLAATVSDSMSRVSMGNHALSGTASYMSPQQLDGGLPQVTDDIYSLGSTLYELLTSRAPFFTGDIAHQVRSLPVTPIPKRLGQLRIENQIPEAIGDAIMACLVKESALRPQSARALGAQMGFWPALSGNTSVASPAAVPQPVASALETRPTTADDAVPRLESSDPPAPLSSGASGGTRRKRILALAFVILGLGILVPVLWWIQQRGAGSETIRAAPIPPPVPEFIALFNGRDLSGWDGTNDLWSVEDGAIVGRAPATGDRRLEALFWRGGEVGDFELRLSVRIERGNSGIYYRATQLGGYEVSGYQFELFSNKTGVLLETGAGRLRREPSRAGSVTVARVTNEREQVTIADRLESPGEFKPDAWNDVIIIARGNHLTHKVNGRTFIETTDHYDKRPGPGTIAFEIYGREPTTVRFRDIRLKHLPSPPPRVPSPAVAPP